MKWLEYNKANITSEQRLSVNKIIDYYLNSITKACEKQIANYNMLSKTQQKCLHKIAYDMFKHFLGDEFIANHYEIFSDYTAGDPIYAKYKLERNNNIYLTYESSSTLRALAQKGQIEIVEAAGRGIDRVRVLFNLCFSEIKLTEVE